MGAASTDEVSTDEVCMDAVSTDEASTAQASAYPDSWTATGTATAMDITDITTGTESPLVTTNALSSANV